MTSFDREKRRSARLEFFLGKGPASAVGANGGNNGHGEERELQQALLYPPAGANRGAISPSSHTETLSSDLSPYSIASSGEHSPSTPTGFNKMAANGGHHHHHHTVQEIEEEVLEALEAQEVPLPLKDGEGEHHPTTSNMQTLANFIKGNIGTGILSLPHAMKNAGLLVGTVATLAVGFLCTYCMHQLLYAYRKIAQGRPMDYADVAEQVFLQSKYQRLNSLAKTARYTTNAFLVLTQLGICCVYLVFCPKMIKEVVDYYMPDWNFVPMLYYQAGLTLLMIPYCFVTTLRVLSLFSMIANFLTIACLLAILQYVFRNLRPIDSLPLATNANDFFMFFGSVMFAFESISLVLPLENRMKERDAFGRWNGLMSLGMTFVIALYTGVGFYGYLAFGEDSKLILRNLPDHWVYHATKLVWTLCIFISYNLQMYVPVQIVWPALRDSVNKPWFNRFGEYFLRTGLVLFTFALAATIPCLEQMIALVGALAMSSLALCIPPILEIVVELPQKPSYHRAQSAGSMAPLTGRSPTSIEDGSSAKTAIANGKKPPVAAIQQRQQQLLRVKPPKEFNKCRFALVAIRGTLIFLLGLAGAVVGTYVTVVEIVHLLQSPQGCSS